MNEYQVAILGGGPGGYEAAIRCAQYGLRTVLIEADALGGTCLNRGCIPTKALLQGAELYDNMRDAKSFGISCDNLALDYAKLAARKDRIVKRLRMGVESLEKAHGVTVVQGFGRLLDANTLEVGGEKITADKIILATGGRPSLPPIPGADLALTSDDVLERTDCPENIVIVGGGVIGIEFASLFSMLGKKVTVLEMLPNILAGVDAEIVEQLLGQLKRKRVAVITSAKVEEIREDEVIYSAEGEQKKLPADCCILCVGRKPATRGIGLEEVGVDTQNGYVVVDESLRTSIKNIFAVGDITGKIQLAHVASAQGLVAAAGCAGINEIMLYDIIPSCVYTEPEIAFVGLSEEEARGQGKRIAIGRFDVPGNGRAMTMGSRAGLIKIVADRETGELYGAQIYAPRATDMISEISALLRRKANVHQLGSIVHPHPTISEAILEAAHDVSGMSVHKPPKK